MSTTSANVKENVTTLKKQSQIMEVWKRLRRNKTAVLGLIIFVAMIVVVLISPLLFDYETEVIKQNISNRLQAPSAEHPFGTDELGRDILARVLYGGRASLSISFTAVVFSLTIGGIIGSFAGYFGGMTDMITMRFMDVLSAIPGNLLAITLVASLGPSTQNLVIALSISGIPNFSRIVRGAVLTVREVEYIEAARAIGAKNFVIIKDHILPNCMAPIIVQTTLNVASVILSTAGLSFLGLGVQAPEPEWGALLSNGRTYIRDYPYMTLFPGLAIMTTILSLNLLGDGLRDALDPRLK